MANIYTLEFKEAVCQDYLKTGATKAFIRDKYQLSSGSLIRTWLIQLGHKDIHRRCNCSSFKNKNRILTARQHRLQQQNDMLEERVKNLEQELTHEQKRSQQYQKTLEEKSNRLVMVNITDLIDFTHYQKNEGIIGIFKKWYSKFRN